MRETWEKLVHGTRIFRVQQKLKQCKVRFIEWRKSHKSNAREEIDRIQKEMEAMQQQEGGRD